jgi:hypothetical protein
VEGQRHTGDHQNRDHRGYGDHKAPSEPNFAQQPAWVALRTFTVPWEVAASDLGTSHSPISLNV